MAHSRALLALLVIPSLLQALPAHAAERVSAGFAPGPIWASQSTPTAGSAVRLYTVVYDASPDAIEGSVSFMVDGDVVGSTPFSLDAGASAVESVSWGAVEGSHTISAAITSAVNRSTKTVTAIREATTTSLSISVAPAPPKPAAVAALDTAQTAVASSSPLIQAAIGSATAATESLRTAGISYLSQLAGESLASSTPPKRKGSVLGAEIEATSSEQVASKDSYVAKIAQTLLPIFRAPALFYPIAILLILFVFWLIAKRLRNPSPRGKQR